MAIRSGIDFITNLLMGAKKKYSGGITPARGNTVPPADWAKSREMLEQDLPDVNLQESSGYFTGYHEPTYDMRGQGRNRELDQAISNVGDVTKEFDQDAGFVSQDLSSMLERNARPGMRVDFPPGHGYETDIPNKMLNDDYVGLTVQQGPNGPNAITSQAIPEFSDRADVWDLISNPGAQDAYIKEQSQAMDDLVERFQNMGLDAERTQHRTHVMAKRDKDLGGGYEEFASPREQRGENFMRALERNYFERSGRQYPGPLP